MSANKKIKENALPAAGKSGASNDRLRRMILTALFCALSYICVFVFRIKVSFLTFDAKDAVMTIGALTLGPVSALVMSAVVSFFEYLTVSDTGLWGLLMNFLSSAAFAFTAALIYKYRHTIGGAVAGLASSVAAMTAVMIAANLVITPIYTGMPRESVAALIVPLLLPFNISKAVLNAAIVLLLYKPVSTAFRAAGIRMGISGGGDTAKYRLRGKSLAVLISALVLIAASVCFLVFYLGGDLHLFG